GLGARRALADDDAGRVQVVMQRPPLAQELGREDDVVDAEALAGLGSETYWHRRLDDHRRRRIDRQYVLDDGFDGARVEVIGGRVVVCGSGDDDEVGVFVSLPLAQSRVKIERLPNEVLLDIR